MQSIHKYLLLLALTGIIASCKKSIEDYPQERWEEDVVFDPRDSVGNYARQFLMNVYSYLPNHYAGVNDNALIEAGTDDAVYRYPGSTIESFVNGRWTSWNMPDNVWSKYYTAIRRANTFLAKIDIVPLKTAGMKDQWKAEARFLRAMSYFELLKRWGGVPLLGDAFFDLTSNVDFARNSYDECVQYIVAECDAIKDKLLKENTIADGDFGRITRSAALALKARTLLYAASALNNTSNNATKWQAAAQASKDIIDLGYHALNSNFTTLFTTRRSTEVILGFQAGTNNTLETNHGPIGYSGTGAGSGLMNPTQSLVDAFPMKNGKAITESGSGYSDQNPYANRDPRLAATILYNTATWLNRPVELYTGGRDYDGSQTGYYMRKFLGAFTTSTGYSATNHNAMIFRYAEVLLNYAEALNEANATAPEEAYKAIESVRQRAGLTPFAIARGMSQADLRKLIRNERRIELAFEDHRFWDIRRWNIGAETINKTVLSGVAVTKNGSTYTYAYNRPVLTTAAWDDKMYRYPIPVAEIEKSKLLIQNKGW
ncbi:RagB/SusD family nutrient uptake outer membrane protein [Paraflavitalea sp. CAU 1676]|uniref:RagB/SusD family nutrient uptake outer membrane protein n=1 Tax=Paraflavitalea sp. CAU 1676 TaxID=3032598 RepID=UPI0023D9C59E|nr:RagB/SusD family nutrient uptake outer membrane protein [Paraflavitalea sp. CAU 1676]MDF2188622.1 RagB/SusD family nutrient uptake outer membrane protein [Paraflavitalea sp. CAU 1676]